MPDPLPLVERLRPLIEPLSDYAHEAWAGWMRYLFNKSAPLNEDGTVTIPKWAVERWLRQSAASYAELPEAEKESDRDEARKMLAIVEPALREAAAALEAQEVEIERLAKGARDLAEVAIGRWTVENHDAAVAQARHETFEKAAEIARLWLVEHREEVEYRTPVTAAFAYAAGGIEAALLKAAGGEWHA